MSDVLVCMCGAKIPDDSVLVMDHQNRYSVDHYCEKCHKFTRINGKLSDLFSDIQRAIINDMIEEKVSDILSRI